MSLESEVAGLTTATTNLLTAVNVSKATVDQAAANAAASAVIANTKAGEASGSAANALAIYGNTEAMNTAVSTAQAQASLAAGYAASAASVAQQDLSAVSANLHRSPNAVTAMFIYDTSKDSDGGAWTEKCQQTSWYNETIYGKWLGAQASEAAARAVSGATTGDYFQLTTDGKFYKLNAGSGTTEVFRGNKRSFPKVAAIVAEESSINIYDLTEPGQPLWRRKTNSKAANGTPISFAAINGKIYMATDLYSQLFDFAKDYFVLYFSNIKVENYSLSTSFGAGIWGEPSGTPVLQPPKAIAATILPDAPVDPVTGLKVPTIAIATAGGISIIQNTGTVRNSSLTSAFTQITITPQLLSAGLAGTTWYYAQNPGALGASFALSSDTNTAGPDFNAGNTTVLKAKDRSTLARSSGAVVQLLRNNEATVGKGIGVKLSNTFNTGHLIGDIRRCFLSDVTTGSVTGPELVTNGDFSNGTTGWTSSNGDITAVTDGVAEITVASNSGLLINQLITCVVGRVYRVSADLRRGTVTGGVRIRMYDNGYLNGGSTTTATDTTLTTVTGYFTATTTTMRLFVLSEDTTIGRTLYADNISVKEVIPDRSYKAAGANIYGTLTASAVNTGNSLVTYSGFSAANYLREPYSADLDFGTGEWSVGAWVNVPVSLPVESFPVVGPELVGDPNIDGNGWWTLYGTGVSIGSGVATFATSGAVGGIVRNGVLTIGNVYQVTVVVSRYVSGAIILGDYVLAPYSGQTFPQSVGTHTVTIVAKNSSYLYLQRDSGVNGGVTDLDVTSISVKELSPAFIAVRSFSTGPKINLGVTGAGRLTATAFDGTTTRTVTTSAAYNTGTWTKARATYTTDGTLSIMVNGVNVATTTGTPLLTLNNSNAVLTIGNSYALDAPFPGSIALLKLSATVPTQEQATWMYEQEKHLFTAGAQCVLPSSGNVLDLAYDDETDTWSALQATHESTWSGLVRTGTQTPSAGSFAKATATSGIKLLSRTTTNPGVDVQIPARNLKAELARRREVLNANQDVVVFDYFGGFTATTTNGSTALTSVAASLYPSTTNLIGCAISGTGIPASTVITGISNTTIYMSKAATATGSTIQISTTDFNLPVGYTARAVMTAGTLKREGSTADYTKLFDGFKETIRYAVAPGYNAWVQIQAVKEVM